MRVLKNPLLKLVSNKKLLLNISSNENSDGKSMYR